MELPHPLHFCLGGDWSYRYTTLPTPQTPTTLDKDFHDFEEKKMGFLSWFFVVEFPSPPPLPPTHTHTNTLSKKDAKCLKLEWSQKL